MIDARYLNQTKYAEHLGVSKARISQLAAEGRIVFNEAGLVDVVASDRSLAETLDTTKRNRDQLDEFAGDAPSSSVTPAEDGDVVGEFASDTTLAQSDEPASLVTPQAPSPEDQAAARAAPPRNPGAVDLWNFRAKREEVAWRREDLALQEKLGKIVNAQEVADGREEAAFQLANALMMAASRVAPQANPADPQRAEAAIRNELRRTLGDLAADFKRQADEDDKRTVAG